MIDLTRNTLIRRKTTTSRERPLGLALGLAGGLAMALGAGGLSAPANAQLFSSGNKPVASSIGRAPATFADIVERVQPAVVSIQARRGGKVSTSSRRRRGDSPRQRGPNDFFPNLPDDHPLNELFKNRPRNFGNSPKKRRRGAAAGSGFVISADGYVVTNNHVIDGTDEITVSFDQKEKLEAELVGTDPRTDLALLKIKSKRTFKYVKLADKPARVGDWVIAVGNPFGLGGTVTAGIVSALARDIGSGPYDYLQIDAAVNRGNSGGPTFNLDGDVVGINTAIYSPSGGNVGIAFAVPAATAKQVIAELKSKGTVTRGWLGVKIRNVGKDTASSLGLKTDKGALVAEVTNNSPAQKGGLRDHDVIKSVNGKAIESSKDLSLKIADYKPGTTVNIVVYRGNGEKTVKITLGTFPTSKDQLARLNKRSTPSATTESGVLGLTVQPVSGKGLRITDIDEDGAAAKSGLSTGDIITHVNQQPVSKAAELEKMVKDAKSKKRPKVMLGIRSKNQRRLVFVEIGKG